MPTQLLKLIMQVKKQTNTTKQTPNSPGTMDNPHPPPHTTLVPLNSPVTDTKEVQPMFDKMVSISKTIIFLHKESNINKQASIFHVFDCVLPPQTSYTSSTMMHCRAGTMSPEVCTKPSTSEVTVSSGISAVSVCQVHHERKATEYSSYHISPHITVTPKSSKHGPGSPERSISTSVEQFRFAGRNFCFSSQKATGV